MNSARYLMLVLFISVTSGCASFGQMEDGLNSLMGRNEQDAFSVLGYPSGKQQFGGDTVYIWEVVDSLSNRTTLSFLEDLMGRPVAEAFAGPMIQFFDRRCKRFIRDVSEIRAFREIPSQQSV